MQQTSVLHNVKQVVENHRWERSLEAQTVKSHTYVFYHIYYVLGAIIDIIIIPSLSMAQST